MSDSCMLLLLFCMSFMTSNRAISIFSGLRMSSDITHSNVMDVVSVPAINNAYNIIYEIVIYRRQFPGVFSMHDGIRTIFRDNFLSRRPTWTNFVVSKNQFSCSNDGFMEWIFILVEWKKKTFLISNRCPFQ